ncbi:hypothetical protein CSV80_06845 [Sporosarcina sp. P12(2017)]|nr:hypothetical protein CSV81_07165 [Sporosarcina sp. P10]PIC61038.1 hypothetical protein CSV80_06845 [Sporosarcina sp. P12(2017)]
MLNNKDRFKRLTGSVDGERNDTNKSNNNRFSTCFIDELTIKKQKKEVGTEQKKRKGNESFTLFSVLISKYFLEYQSVPKRRKADS